MLFLGFVQIQGSSKPWVSRLDATLSTILLTRQWLSSTRFSSLGLTKKGGDAIHDECVLGSVVIL
jgi:hypothetical protein